MSTIAQEANAILFQMDSLLVQYGWCQREYRGAQGQFCLVAAYMSAEEGHRAKAKMLVYDTLVELAQANVNGLQRWNDADRRTKRGVRALIAKAIKVVQKAA